MGTCRPYPALAVPDGVELTPIGADLVAERYRGKIVVVLPVRNEGDEPVHTVRSLRAARAPGTTLHFVAVDDGSTDRCCEVLKHAADITVVQNHEPQGEGRCRNLGAHIIPDADCYVWMDAHMRMETKFGLERLALATESGAAVCAVTGNTNLEKDFRGYGATLVWRTEKGQSPKERPGLHCQWAYVHNEWLQPVQALLGACYAMSRPTFDRIGGWLDTEGLYGFAEPALAISAFFQGIPVACHTQVLVRHRFRVARPYPMTGAYYWQNFAFCLRVMFRRDTFERVFLPVATKAICHGGVRYLEVAPWVETLRAAFATRKVHSDEECLAWLRIP